jgi:Cu(I)/Ag(I) efflux system membrane protein CusA/SilA
MYLLAWSGYNFSVAVWVGFIALFGTAVQTAMLMVVYLEEAVSRWRDRLDQEFDERALKDAVIEGALLRLRPKIMTTSTVVLSLLPIMWTSRVGSEVLKPLATPVLGGMISSLLHVLIITPVLFYAIRRRALVAHRAPAVPVAPRVSPQPRRPAQIRRAGWIVGMAVIAAMAAVAWLFLRPASPAKPLPPGSVVLASAEAGDLKVAAVGPPGTPGHGRSRVVIEFRDKASNALVDVGAVSGSGEMSMPAMVMTTALTGRMQTPGRYDVEGDYGMAGEWRLTLEWRGGAKAAGRAVLKLEVH